MPNRGPIAVTLQDCATLLGELPPERDLKEAEDDEGRQRIKLHMAIRRRVEEQNTALEQAGGSGNLILSVDEVEEIIDVLPPPPMLADVRKRLSELLIQLRDAAARDPSPAVP